MCPGQMLSVVRALGLVAKMVEEHTVRKLRSMSDVVKKADLRVQPTIRVSGKGSRTWFLVSG